MTISPRPWIAEPAENGTWRVVCRSAVPRGAPVILASFLEEADARVIAAAWDLKESLEQLGDVLAAPVRPGIDFRVRKALAHAAAALHKASL